MAVKDKSPAKMTFYCGYSNGVVGYFSTAAEYPYGGYEPAISHRGYGLPSPYSPECEKLLVDKGIQLIEQLFS